MGGSISVELFAFTNLFVSSISILSCFLLFFLVWRKSAVTTATKMIILISLGDLYLAFIQLIAEFMTADNKICSFLQTSLNLSLWSSVSWSTALAILSYKSLISPRTFLAKRFFKRCVLFIFTISLLVSLYPLLHSSLIRYEKTDDGFCFVTPQDDYSIFMKTLLMFLFQGLPIIIAITVTCWCYFKEIIMLQDVMESVGNSLNVSPKKLLWYPICQLLVYTPHTVLDFIAVYNQETSPTLILFIFFVLEKLPGLMNTLVYLVMNKPFSKRELEQEIDDYDTWDDSPVKSRSDERSYDPRMLIEGSSLRSP